MYNHTYISQITIYNILNGAIVIDVHVFSIYVFPYYIFYLNKNSALTYIFDISVDQFLKRITKNPGRKTRFGILRLEKIETK